VQISGDPSRGGRNEKESRGGFPLDFQKKKGKERDGGNAKKKGDDLFLLDKGSISQKKDGLLAQESHQKKRGSTVRDIKGIGVGAIYE